MNNKEFHPAAMSKCPEPEDVLDKLRDMGPNADISILVLKPGFYNQTSKLIGHTFGKLTESLIESARLSILFSSEKQINSDEIQSIYRTIYSREPIFPDALIFRSELLEYMQSSELTCFLVVGDDAQCKLELIKKTLRNLTNIEPGTSIVRNIVHVPEEHEIGMAIEALFL